MCSLMRIVTSMMTGQRTKGALQDAAGSADGIRSGYGTKNQPRGKPAGISIANARRRRETFLLNFRVFRALLLCHLIRRPTDRPEESEHDLRRYRILHQVQVYRLRGCVPGGLFP